MPAPSRTTARSNRTAALPPSATAFLQRRLTESAGAVLLGLGLALAVALISYDFRDPSWNTAAQENHAVTNLLGQPGSHIADLLLQTLGLGAYALSGVTMAWGWRIMTRQGLSKAPIRVLLALAGVMTAAATFSAIPAFSGWLPGHARLGGMAGSLLLGKITGLTGVTFISALVMGCVTAGLLGFAAGYSLEQWKAGFAKLRGLLGLAGRGTRDAAVSLRDPAERLFTLTRSTAERLRREPRLADEPVSASAPQVRSASPVDLEEDDVPEFLAPEPEEYETAPREKASSITIPPKSRIMDLGRKKSSANQPTLDLEPSESGEFELPPQDLLQRPLLANRAEISEESLRQNAEMLESVLSDFGVRGEIVKVHPGPVVTLYELEPAPGTKSSRVISLADDIARSMSAISVRVAVVPGRNVIGIEMPNAKRETVYLRELLAADAYDKSQARLALVLGKDIGGGPVIADLARMPHLLVAGTTGSGKSVAVNTMILSLLYRLPPEKCRFIMVDPKMLELSIYEGIPHLLAPVVTDPKKAVVALKWAVREMEDRYRAMSKLGVRNIDGYNARLAEARKNGEVLTRRVQTGFDPDTGKPVLEEQPIDLTELPYIVVIVDEMADLMLVAGKDIEAAIQRLAQMARAAGIHLIMATQRPSVDVITGTIKANFPTRISFQVTSKIDSRTILGEQGAEQLLGQGDMLYMAGGGRITRVHGPFVSDGEVEAVVKFLRAQGEPSYVDAVTEDDGESMGGEFDDEDGGASVGSSGDELYDKAVAIVCRERKASTSFVQRHLRIGYNSAARLIERMEREGVISQANHAGKREVLARNVEGDE